jgi:ribosomal peptide maturation radical SAM protein 1
MSTFLGYPTGTVEHEEPSRKLRVLLVCMPWFGLHLPSLALSTLAPAVEGLPWVGSVEIRYTNLEWAEHLYEKSNHAIDSTVYGDIADGQLIATGEWIFSGVLYGEPDPTTTRYYRAVTRRGIDLAAASEMFLHAHGFVDGLATEIAAGGYDVVGFTSTFMQNTPSLALARAIKSRAPEAVTVFGGANCDDVQGAALHRCFPFVDYVVRGEGEEVFPALLRHLASGNADDPSYISGLCWRDGGRPVANDQANAPLPMDRVPSAQFDAYFDAFDSAPVCHDVRPKIVLEGGRGCWWGQKHHCTFCGLNGTLMAFRAKSPERVLDELQLAVRRHRVLDVVFADNILDQRYVRELMPALAARHWDLRMFFEVKSNLTYSQLAALADAGVAQVQPGIESLCTPVLRLMRKGVTAWQNVRFLRDCMTLRLDVGWNFLYGFPGETTEDYLEPLRQLPNLVHLKPPDGAFRVALTRFSPYFNDAGLGFSNLGPSSVLAAIYQLSKPDLTDLVYLFDSAEAGVVGNVAGRLAHRIDVWQADHAGRRLVALPRDHGLLIVDERIPGEPVEVELGVRDATLYRALLKGRTLDAAVAHTKEAGLEVLLPQARESVDDWVGRGLVFRDGQSYVALATGLGY